MGQFLDAALDAVDRGHWVFPLSPGSKLPAIEDFPHMASRDPEQIRQWWTCPVMGWEHPRNVGISTTQYGDDEGLIVVDVDNKNGRSGNRTLLQLAAEGFELPDTREQATPTGGRHLFFRCSQPVKQGAGVLGPGLDIRSRHGYVVGAGSEVEAGVYTTGGSAEIAPAPQWLIERCGRAVERSPQVAVTVAPVDAQRAIKRAIHYLQSGAPASVPGEHNETAYRVVCRLKDMGVAEAECAGLLTEHWIPRCEGAAWSDEDLERVIANAYHYGREPIGAAAPEVQFEPVPMEDGPVATDKPRRLRLLWTADIRLEERPPALVAGLLDDGEMSVMFGASGTGKSFCALDIGFHVATGRDWRGRHRVARGAVVYVAAENPGSIKRRILAIKKRHDLDGTDIPLAVVPCGIDLFHEQGDTAELVELIQEAAARHKPPVKLVVIDTAARALGGADENSGRDMGQFIKHVDQIREQTGAHVMVIHHAGKDETKGARGHSSLKAATDTEMVVRDRMIEVTKLRDGELGDRFAFDLERVVIGQDEEGGLIDSAVLVHRSIREARRLAPPKGNAARVLEALRSAVETGGELFPAEINAPAGARGITVEKWREAYLSATNTTATKKTLCRQFQRGGDTLATSGHVEIREGFCWIKPWRQAATNGDI